MSRTRLNGGFSNFQQCLNAPNLSMTGNSYLRSDRPEASAVFSTSGRTESSFRQYPGRGKDPRLTLTFANLLSENEDFLGAHQGPTAWSPAETRFACSAITP